MATRSFFQAILFSLLAGAAGFSQAPPPKAKPLSAQQKLEYLAGFDIGMKMRASFPELEVEVFAQGVRDAVQGKPSPISPEETKVLYAEFQKKRAEETAKAAAGAAQSGQAFLAANQDKEGVVTLPTGVQYRVLTAGQGDHPTLEDKVVAHYKGTLINGTEFDSSFRHNEPSTFPVKAVIPAWQQVLPLMAVGSKWQVFVPADQAYGPRGAGPKIGPNETLLFEIELLKILKEK